MRRFKRYAPTFAAATNNKTGIEVNAEMMDDLVKSLGRTYSEIVAAGL